MSKFNLKEFDMFGEKKPVEQAVSGTETVVEDVQAVTATTVAKPASKSASTPKAVMPMMNIRFTPENYAYMRKEAATRGLSVIKLTNYIIDLYRSDPAHVHQNDAYQNEGNW